MIPFLKQIVAGVTNHEFGGRRQVRIEEHFVELSDVSPLHQRSEGPEKALRDMLRKRGSRIEE